MFVVAVGTGTASTLTGQTSPTIVGVLQDESGRPVRNAAIQACTAAVCFPSESGDDGRFRFDLQLKTPVQVLLKTPEQLMGQPRRAAAMAPVEVRGTAAIDAGVVLVPTLPAGVALPAAGAGPRALVVGDGLELTLDARRLKAAPGSVVMSLAARRIPTARVPAYRLPAGERVLAVYALHPFGATSEAPVGVRAPLALAAGTPVKFRTVGELDGTLSDPVPGRASGRDVTTSPSVGISHLTYLVISR